MAIPVALSRLIYASYFQLLANANNSDKAGLNQD